MGNTTTTHLPHCVPKGPKKHVCIIGGGASGIIVMKELLALGHKVTCFEMLPVIGGVYVKCYAHTILTTSSLLTAFSDYSDGKEADPRFWTAEEYLNYLHNYVKKHDLMKHIKFSYEVTCCRKCPNTGKWIVTAIGGRGCKNIQRCDDVKEDCSFKPETYTFDAIAVCTGTNNFPCVQRFPGQDDFKGELVHTEDYRTPERFAGKRVLIIGAGESGSDIIAEVSKTASKTAIVIRGLHGHIIPRIQQNGKVTDLNTNRIRYSNPFVFGDWIGFANQIAKRFVVDYIQNEDQKKVLKKVAELNLLQKTSAFSKFGCKNEGFVAAMVLRGAELHRDKFVLKEDRAVFEDGSEFICDKIIACTGYKNAFPFFDEYHPEICKAGMTPRTNYKQCIYVEDPSVCFFGFARPAFGSIPPTVEMQSRLWVYALNGDIALPSKEEMHCDARADAQIWEQRYGYDAKRVIALVDFQLYCDGIAKAIGCMPPLRQLFITKPWMWYKIMCGPFTTQQYRLVGPYPNPQRAEEVLSRTPVGDFVESSVTASFLMTAKALSMMGFEEFTPSEF